MRPVIRLEAPILQIRDIPAGASVGYGASFVAARPSRIATIAVGYADGYLRSLSGRGVAAYRDMILPMVGRVSMDLITLDVTDALGLAPGDRVTPRLRGGLSLAAILDPVAALGRAVLGALQRIGAVVLFALEGISHLLRPPFYGRLFLRHVVEIGYFSLPVVALTAFFTGMVLALQTYTGFARFNAEGAVANVVVLSITRELGPVIAGLMVAGRIGAAFAAEIGTMRVTDQIDALTTLSTNPMKYLVAPRLLAGAIALPFLVLIADTLGVMGGWLIGTAKLGFSSAGYLRATLDFMQTMDVVSGLVKASVFGFVIALMGCWCGYNSKGGAQGVGAAATSAVVTSSILILALDYIITEMFFAR
jgi:phospholipid/cholesterol/gamma-HCH transport system permease protein